MIAADGESLSRNSLVGRQAAWDAELDPNGVLTGEPHPAAEINTVFTRQLSSMKIEDPSLHGTVERLATAVSAAIAFRS